MEKIEKLKSEAYDLIVKRDQLMGNINQINKRLQEITQKVNSLEKEKNE